jgi:hypothetical protein
MPALAGYLGDILITSPPSVTLGTNYALTDSGDHKTYNNPSGSASQRYWDNTSVPVIQTSVDGSTWIAALNPAIRYVNGQVVLPIALTGTAQMRLASGGKYFPYASIGNTTSWDVQFATKVIDATIHKGVGGSFWEDTALTTKSGKVNLKKWWIAELGLIGYLTGSTPIIVSCLTPQANRFEAYCWLSDDKITVASAALIDQPLVFTFTDQCYAV